MFFGGGSGGKDCLLDEDTAAGWAVLKCVCM